MALYYFSSCTTLVPQILLHHMMFFAWNSYSHEFKTPMIPPWPNSSEEIPVRASYARGKSAYVITAVESSWKKLVKVSVYMYCHAGYFWITFIVTIFKSSLVLDKVVSNGLSEQKVCDPELHEFCFLSIFEM